MHSSSSHFGNPLVTRNVGNKQYSNNPYKRRSSARHIRRRSLLRAEPPTKVDKLWHQSMIDKNGVGHETQNLTQSPSSVHPNPITITSTTTTTDLTYSLSSSSRSTSSSYDSASSIGLPSLYPAARRYGKICHQFDSYMIEELEEFDEMFSTEFVDNQKYRKIKEHDCPSLSNTCLDSDSRDEKGAKGIYTSDGMDNKKMISKLYKYGTCSSYLTDFSFNQ